GKFLLDEINKSAHESLKVSSVLVRDREKYKSLESDYGVELLTGTGEFLSSDIDIVVEATTVEAAKELLPGVIKEKDVLLISTGALSDEDLVADVTRNDNEYDHSLHLPSGAIGGLDLLQNAQTFGKLDSVSLETRKPAGSVIGEEIDVEKVVFEGNAAEAIDKYPKSMNISIIRAFAGVGMKDTDVTIIADPKIDRNVNNVKVTGDFGEAEFTFRNITQQVHPKTSHLYA